jgi:hypothetical protein
MIAEMTKLMEILRQRHQEGNPVAHDILTHAVLLVNNGWPAEEALDESARTLDDAEQEAGDTEPVCVTMTNSGQGAVTSASLPDPFRRREMLQLDEHDRALTELVRAAIDSAIANAHMRSAVAKRIAVVAMGHRNNGRNAAIRRYPFKNICEVSGAPLAREHADLDELDPELGYAGRLRWVCKLANNSGKASCGVCKSRAAPTVPGEAR